MPFPVQTGRWRHTVLHLCIRLSVGPFICSSICYQTCQYGILKMNEPVLMHIGTNGPWDNGMKWSTLGLKKSWSNEAKDRFGGVAEAFLTALG